MRRCVHTTPGGTWNTSLNHYYYLPETVSTARNYIFYISDNSILFLMITLSSTFPIQFSIWLFMDKWYLLRKTFETGVSYLQTLALLVVPPHSTLYCHHTRRHALVVGCIAHPRHAPPRLDLQWHSPSTVLPDSMTVFSLYSCMRPWHAGGAPILCLNAWSPARHQN